MARVALTPIGDGVTDIMIATAAELSREGNAQRDDALLMGAESIFWETANTTVFASATERNTFREKYFGYYLDAEPEHFLIACEEGTPRAPLGYICGVADTRRHPALYRLADHIPIFDDLYDAFPAHLHINLTAASRGRGLGTRLLDAFGERMAAAGAGGVHLVTSPGARNVAFYQRAGFTTAEERTLEGIGGEQEVSLLFLGKKL